MPEWRFSSARGTGQRFENKIESLWTKHYVVWADSGGKYLITDFLPAHLLAA